jgi:hypothetical protein
LVIAAMVTDNIRVFLLLLVAQVCLLVMMATSVVQGSRAGPVTTESTPACCLYHPDCCQAGFKFGVGDVAKP